VTMEARELGNTGLRLSVLGLGTAVAGGRAWPGSWGDQSDDVSRATIEYAIQQGVNWIDTAPVYGFGHAEEVVGATLAGVDKQVIVTTKCGVTWENGKPRTRLDRDAVRSDVEASLVRLRRDRIDICLIHFPDPDEQLEEGWSALIELKAEGVIGHVGVSNFGSDQLRRVNALAPVEVIEVEYSLLNRASETETFPFARDAEAGVVVYRTLAAGLLTQSSGRERLRTLDQNDWRRRSDDFQGASLDRKLAVRDQLLTIATNASMTLEQLALGWAARQPPVVSAIVGFRTPAQASAVLARFDPALDAETLAAIDQVLAKQTGGEQS
jgi:aryl-alcohol dehydrogenase-like predicted oxidoreductase